MSTDREWSLRDCDTGAELPFPALFLDDYKGSFPLLMPRFFLISSIFKTGVFVLREKNAAPNIGHSGKNNAALLQQHSLANIRLQEQPKKPQETHTQMPACLRVLCGAE